MASADMSVDCQFAKPACSLPCKSQDHIWLCDWPLSLSSRPPPPGLPDFSQAGVPRSTWAEHVHMQAHCVCIFAMWVELKAVIPICSEGLF